MLYKLAAYVHAFFFRRAQGIRASLEGERGQGTVEYVGLILRVPSELLRFAQSRSGARND